VIRASLLESGLTGWWVAAVNEVLNNIGGVNCHRCLEYHIRHLKKAQPRAGQSSMFISSVFVLSTLDPYLRVVGCASQRIAVSHVLLGLC
jgi:hypothetical protein